MYNPNLTRVCLLNVPLENDYKHTLWFNNTTNQTEYFLSKKKLEFTELTYQRKDNSIKVPKQYDELLGCNYVMYQNSTYNSKWFYAFITDIKYISDGVTEIFVETDCIQTWLKDYVVKTSFVEREHSYYDNVGENTYPEQVELGEYKCNNKTVDERMQNLFLVCAINDYANEKIEVKGNVYDGVYSGVKYIVYPYNSEGVTAINNDLSEYDDDAKAEAINSIFLVPECVMSETEGFTLDGPAEMLPSWEPKEHVNIINKQTTLDEYIPRNNKLLCYPYNYLLVSNNAGSGAVYHYEKFSGGTCNFAVKSTITPGCSIRMFPRYYNGMELNTDEGLNGGKYPLCCWNSDAFTNWMTANSVNNAVGIIGGVATTALGIGAIATGAGALVGASMIAGGVSAIGGTIGQIHQASHMPDQAKGNTNCGDVVTAGGYNTFMFYNMSIKREYARIIDGYFDMFGYKTCYVKVPYTNHRERYWFTKTIDVNIDGAIPNKDLQKIKDAYNNGITFWKNPSDIGNYPYYQDGTLYYSNNVTH